MAGRIREEDIVEVRERARIDDVVSGYVTLRRAGGGSLKGLCPFHDEKSPSFHVTPSRGFFHCFGCSEGGDVITFLMKIDGLSFTEAVERLAEKVGITLRREETPGGGGARDDRPKGPQRRRLVEAHAVAQEFYAERLGGPDAVEARKFLTGRGFDQTAAEQFGIGFAPRDGDALYRHLRGRKFSEAEVVAAGLVAQGRSLYDRFRGRLLWPIRESNGDTVGFGARRIFDDDRIEAKYLNTPETPIYKKSHVLYGLDLARREIDRTSQAVIVEGYTDVMACHLAGVGTAVATCGTAFGDEHARVLRRFLDSGKGGAGEVIFTFDGDTAGQNAALRAFGTDQHFASQTYAAVEPNGLDPCDLRLQRGDEAVRDLIAARTPLYRMVLGNVLSKFDLDRADSRVDATREAAKLVSSLRDRSKVDAFAREIAGMIGIDVEQARAEVNRAQRRKPEPARNSRDHRGPQPPPAPQPAAPVEPPRPRLTDPRFAIERETLKLVLQHPALVGRRMSEVGPEHFMHPTFREVWGVVSVAGGPMEAAGSDGWAARLRDGAGDPRVASAISELAVDPPLVAGDPSEQYVAANVFKLRELTASRRIEDVKSRLQRTNPNEQPEAYNQMFGELMTLEQQRRSLRDSAVGAP